MDDLQAWMTANRETDASMAPKLSVSRVQVSRIRRGKCRPSPETALKLERITQIPASTFIFAEFRP